MRYLLLIVAIALGLTAFSQTPRPTTLPSPNSTGYAKWGYVRGDSAFLLGLRGDTTWVPITSALSAVKFAGRDTSILYFYDGVKWKPAGAGAGGGSTVDSFFYQLRQLNDTTVLFDRGDGVVDTLAISGSGGGGGSGLNKVDSVTTVGDSLFYWINGDEYFVANLAAAAAGGDTTIFVPIIDTTGNDNYRVLYAKDNKITASSYMKWSEVFNRLTISPTSIITSNYDSIRLVVDGAIYTGRLVSISGRFENNGGSGMTASNDSLKFTPTPSATDTSTYKPAALSSTGGLVRMSSWPITPSIDTTSLSDRINLKLNISDTAAMLSPYLKVADTVGTGSLYIRNQLATQESKTFNIRSGRLDSLYASGSGGVHFATNTGASAFEYGGGGGTQVTFNGFAGYNANSAASYTARSFTDKNYVDSAIAAGGGGMANPMTTTGDLIYSSDNSGTPARLGIGSTGQVLTVSGGVPTWAAASGGGVSTVGTFSGSSQTNGATISGSTITFGPADATNPGMVSTGAQTWAGDKTYTGNIKPFSTSIDWGTNFSSEALLMFNDGTNKYGWGLSANRMNFFIPTSTQDYAWRTGSSVSGTVLATLSGTGSFNANSFITGPTTGQKIGYYGSNAGVGIRSGHLDFFTFGSNQMNWHFTGSLPSSTSTATLAMTENGIAFRTSGVVQASAAFEVASTTRGFLQPRMTGTQRDAIGTPATGLQVYNTTTSQPNYRDGSTWQAQVGMTFGTAAPTSTPTAVGNFFLDTTNKKLYVATGTASSADWEILN